MDKDPVIGRGVMPGNMPGQVCLAEFIYSVRVQIFGCCCTGWHWLAVLRPELSFFVMVMRKPQPAFVSLSLSLYCLEWSTPVIPDQVRDHYVASLWHKGTFTRTFPCMEATYHAITTHQKTLNPYQRGLMQGLMCVVMA